MQISQSPFGQVEGSDVSLFTLENDNSMAVKITNYGGIVTSMVIPDRRGQRSDIVCGFDTLDGYFSAAYQGNSPYFGCIVGRYAGRIKDGRFNVDDKTYQVATNDDPNHLHGGMVGFDKQIWDAECSQADDACELKLSLVSPDGDEGYPGTLDVSVEYHLTQENELRIRYQAQTDKATPLALTNHTYFNLNSFSDKILDHRAEIHSDRTLVPDGSNVPVGGEQRVEGTACDFNTARPIGDAFKQLPKGFEHYYCFAEGSGVCAKVAVFSEQSSGRTLEVETTEPGMLFYTGFYTSDDLKREDGTQFGQFKAFCCETAKYPNGPNLKDAPASILEPGQTYDETTLFRLKW